MTHTESLSVRIAVWEDAAAELPILRDQKAQLTDELGRCDQNLQAAERAAAVLARMGDIVALAEAGVSVIPPAPEPLDVDPSQEAQHILSPEGDKNASPEVPEPEVTPVEDMIAESSDAAFDPVKMSETEIDAEAIFTSLAESSAPEEEPAAEEAPAGTAREQLLDLIGANADMQVSDLVSCLPHLNPATVAATVSKMCMRGEVIGTGSPKRFTLPSEASAEPEAVAEPEQPAPVEPDPPQTVIRDHPPQTRTPAPPAPEPRKAAQPREVSLPRDLPPLAQVVVKATPVEVEIVQGALKHHGRPMSKSLLLGRVSKAGIRTGVLDDALRQLVADGVAEESDTGRFGIAGQREAV